MPSTYTDSLRLELQATGENTNVWGSKLNANTIALIEKSIAGIASFTLSGAKTLTSANGAADEARAEMLNITGGSGGTITIPSVSKGYKVRNAASGNVIITTGAGATATIAPGGIEFVLCDGTNVYAFGKTYVDTAILNASLSPEFPGQAGNAGKFLQTDGTNATWQAVQEVDDPILTGDVQVNGSQRGEVIAVSGTDIDCSAGNYFAKTVNGAITFTFSNVPSGAFAFTLRITHTSGAITWPATVWFANGIAPTLTTGHAHLFVFATDDGGANWRCGALVDFAA